MQLLKDASRALATWNHVSKSDQPACVGETKTNAYDLINTRVANKKQSKVKNYMQLRGTLYAKVGLLHQTIPNDTSTIARRSNTCLVPYAGRSNENSHVCDLINTPVASDFINTLVTKKKNEINREI